MGPAVLVMLWNCPDCVKIKARLDSKHIFNDDNDGFRVHVAQVMSNEGYKDICSRLIGTFMPPPMLITDGGALSEFEDVDRFLSEHLQGYPAVPGP